MLMNDALMNIICCVPTRIHTFIDIAGKWHLAHPLCTESQYAVRISLASQNALESHDTL